MNKSDGGGEDNTGGEHLSRHLHFTVTVRLCGDGEGGKSPAGFTTDIALFLHFLSDLSETCSFLLASEHRHFRL